jgi:hypothetical protein
MRSMEAHPRAAIERTMKVGRNAAGDGEKDYRGGRRPEIKPTAMQRITKSVGRA